MAANIEELSELLNVAYEVLIKEGSELHVNAIALKAILAGKHFNLTQEVLTKKLNQALVANLKKAKPHFAKALHKNGKPKKGIYRARKLKVSPLNTAEPPLVSNLFTGKAGEYAVMGELLFWGFNVSLMSVDEGVDVVAAKNNKFFHIQVKTTNQDLAGKYGYTVKKQSFSNNDASTTFYIFVMRNKNEMKYAVLPSSEIRNGISLGFVGGDLTLSMGITYDKESKRYMLNKRRDISIFVNNFEQIK